MTPYLAQALRLHRYLTARHWDDGALVGPDSGVRVNYRLGRFVKSYLGAIPWRDSYYYLQTQGYWVLGNWILADLTADENCRMIAERASAGVLRRQRHDGAWEYPNREWAGRVATAEGTWAALGLVESFRRTADGRFLRGATAWHDFLERSIGYQHALGGIAVNYFATGDGGAVPNNSVLVLRLLAELAAVGVPVEEPRISGLVSFVRAAQLPSGELPYELPADDGPDGGRRHFQCFQYNAFQCLDLLAYHDVTGDGSVHEVVQGLAAFLRTGVADDGHVFFDCRRGRRTVTYHTAAVAAALSRADRLGVMNAGLHVDAAYGWLLSQQRPDGGLAFSRNDYVLLHDRRSYPRNLAMILFHLLVAHARSDDTAPVEGRQ